ncbi:MAG: hypothetical protein H6668_09860 [Ardenticatenaceae bacterium]|nr:hypothetical protein [Ardenticatenaceae bacterium]
MINRAQAIAFVQANGNARELARLVYLTEGKRPSPDIIAQFAASQRDDGGWAPFWAEISSVDATCYQLAQLEQLGLGVSEPVVAQALTFLRQRRQVNGAWEEETVVADQAPPWAKPGNLAAMLYLTANCGFWLAVLGNEGALLMPTTQLLRQHLALDGALPSFLHTHWLAAALWLSLGEMEPATAVFNYLTAHLNKLSANNLTWLLTAVQATGRPVAHPFLTQARDKLVGLQMENGRWPSDDAMERDVHVTLEALRVFAST